MNIQPVNISRDDFARFLPDPRTVRAFENITGNADEVQTTLASVQFLTLTDAPTLGSERLFTPVAGELVGTDGGANSAYTLGLSDTGILPGVYGDATNFISITVDIKGRITSVTEYPASGGITGTVTLDFGAFPGSNEASISFADTSILAGSIVRAWFAADSVTADHTADDHKYAPVFISLTALPTAGVGGTIYARSDEKMQGQWLVNWEWS